MKKLHNFLPLAFLGLCLWIATSCMDASKKQPNKSDSLTSLTATSHVSDTTQISFSDVQDAVSRVDSLSRLITDYKRIESNQNGVCDTCVTGFVSVLIEHRTVSKKLSDEVSTMNRNLERVKAFNAKSFSLINSYQRQSGELSNIVSLRATLIQENTKQVAELRKSKLDLTSSSKLLEKSRY